MNAFSASAINTSELDYYINILHEAWMNSNLKSAAKQLSREADDPTISASDARNNIESTLALLDQNVTRNGYHICNFLYFSFLLTCKLE